jgi:hypothetical protein
VDKKRRLSSALVILAAKEAQMKQGNVTAAPLVVLGTTWPQVELGEALEVPTTDGVTKVITKSYDVALAVSFKAGGSHEDEQRRPDRAMKGS